MLQNTISKASVDRVSFSNGLMPAAAAERFIQMIFESTPLLKAIRTIPMKAEKLTLAGILENKGQSRFVGVNSTGDQASIDSEDQSSYRHGLSTYSFTLETEELALSRTVSNKVLEDSVESQNLGNTIAKNLSEMIRVDIEDAALNSKLVDSTQSISATLSNAPGAAGTTFQVGASQPAWFPVDGSNGHGYLRIDKSGDIELAEFSDLVDNAGNWEFQGVTRAVADEDGQITSTAITLAIGDTVTWHRHHLKGLLNGFVELFENPLVLNSNIVDGSAINGGSVSYSHFNTMIQSMLKKYRSPENVFLMSYSQFDNYRQWLLTNHSQAVGLNIISDGTFAPIEGHKVITPIDFPDDKIILTNLKNLILGIWKNIKMRKITADTDVSLADTDETYWNLRMRLGFGIERPDAGVLCTELV